MTGCRGVAWILPALLIAAAALPAAAQEPEDDPPPRNPINEESTWWRKANVGYGPFRETSLSVFSTCRMNLAPRFPSSLPARTFEARLESGWAKNNTLGDLWDIDFEVVASTVAFTWSLTDEARVELEIASGQRTGGGLDALILGFHDTFGLAFGDRKRHSRNDFVFDVNAPDAGPPVRLDRTSDNPFVEAALVTFQHVLTYGNVTLPAVSWGLTLRTQLSEGDLDEASPADLGASFAVSKEIAWFQVYAGAAAMWYGRDDFYGIKFRTWQWAGQAAVEWRALPGFSIIAQWVITAGAVDDLRDFSKPSHEVGGGFKWEVTGGILFEASLIENIINFENSPDLGFHFGITMRW